MGSVRPDKCPSCGSDYEVTYYQRRAADEPPDKVTYCPVCPVDTGKLSLQYANNLVGSSTIPNDRAVKTTREFTRKIRGSTPTSILAWKETRYVIKVEGSAASRCYSRAVCNLVEFTPIVETLIPVTIHEHKELANFQLRSLTGGEAHIVVDTKRIAPYVSLQKVDILTPKSSIPAYSRRAVSGYECMLDSIEGSDLTILRTLPEGRQPQILIYVSQGIQADSVDKTMLSILEQVLVEYGTEVSIKSFVDASIISALYVQSAKAYDWPSAPTEGYTYTWKPDGERFWYVKYGSVWIFCRRLLSGRIAGWNVSTSLQTYNKAGPILDVEVMIGHPPILIDVLVLQSGIATPIWRSLEYVLTEYRSMNNIDVPIFTRDYFNSERELLGTKDNLQYPVDGVVGIENGSMDIIKLKDTKSIELELQDNGSLLSSDRQIVMTSSLQSTYKPHSIIEVRFTKNSSQDELSITEVILRTDKTTANSYEVCKDILNTISAMPDTLARHKAVVWCNTIRHRLHQVASNSTNRGRVIVDIGSGDGQAISDYSVDPTVTYLLIEPDSTKCKKLLKRIGEYGSSKCRLYDDPRSILKVLGLLSTGSLKYAIVNSTLEALLSQDQFTRMLRSCTRYCIASFSVSYIADSLSTLALNGLDIVGCGYMYDSAGPDGKLIDEFGVKMIAVKDKSRAKVTWGSDREYEEPIVKICNFSKAFYVQLATTVVPVVIDDEESLLNTISSKVYIISTKKHI